MASVQSKANFQGLTDPEPRSVRPFDPTERLAAIIATQTEIACADLDLDGVMRLVAHKAQQLTGAEGAVVDMTDGEFLVYRAAAGTGCALEGTRIPIQGSLSGLGIRTGDVLRCDDALEDPRIHRETCLRFGVRSMLVVPLRHDRRVVGVLKVISGTPYAFERGDVEALQLVSSLLGVAIGRASDARAKAILIDERAAALAALEMQSGMLRNFFEAAPFMMSVVQRAGDEFRYLSVNPALAAAYQRTPAQVVGKLGSEVGFPAKIIAKIQGVQQEALQSGKPVQFEYRVGKQHLLSTVCVIPDTGPDWHFTAITQDVTETMAMRQRLDLSDRMATVGRLAAGVAHEANNPLAFVVSNLQYLAEEVGELRATLPEAKQTELLEVLKETSDGAERVRAIVRDLYMFSRADAQALKPVNVLEVLEKSLMMAMPEIRYRAQLVRECTPIPFVMGNDARLGQVLLNLLVNAAQAIPLGDPEKQRIVVRSRTLADGRVSLSVSDTGEGIPAETLPRIFDPFFTTKPLGQGMGLGLSICHSIVRDHGGELSVESSRGRGATFTVVLPAL